MPVRSESSASLPPIFKASPKLCTVFCATANAASIAAVPSLTAAPAMPAPIAISPNPVLPFFPASSALSPAVFMSLPSSSTFGDVAVDESPMALMFFSIDVTWPMRFIVLSSSVMESSPLDTFPFNWVSSS